jgi:hypothetical protein
VETSFQNLVLANFPYEPNLAHQKNWKNIWIESDSALVVLAFENHEMHHVTWSLRNKWLNVQFLLRQMHCIVTHIYGEGVQLADFLANHDFTLTEFCIWHDMLMSLLESFV